MRLISAAICLSLALVSSAFAQSIPVTLPASLEPHRAEIEAMVEWRYAEFLERCYEYQNAQRCDRVAARVKVTVVDDFTFREGASYTGLASGSYGGGRVRVALFNKINTDDPAQCLGSIRDRQEMYILSGRKRYWLNHVNAYFCANIYDLLPALVHELCHAVAGPRSGHGLEDCQTRRAVQ